MFEVTDRCIKTINRLSILILLIIRPGKTTIIKKVEDTLNLDTSLCSDGQQGNREAVLAQSSGAAQRWPLCTAGLPPAPAASAEAPVGQRVPPPLASCVAGPPLPRPGHKMFKPRDGGLTLEGTPLLSQSWQVS